MYDLQRRIRRGSVWVRPTPTNTNPHRLVDGVNNVDNSIIPAYIYKYIHMYERVSVRDGAYGSGVDVGPYAHPHRPHHPTPNLGPSTYDRELR